MADDDQSDHGVRNSNTTLLQKLASAVNGHAATATFACGGSVPLSELSTGNFGPGVQNLLSSVTIRWDSKDSYYKQSKISFPLPHHDDVSRKMLNFLLHYCEPATFGVGGRDVLDEKYRKAGKLDTSQFSTNFHPHDCGILDSIQQILLPSTIRGGQGIGIGPQGVRAELYKLNVYSAPSGKFMSHVDTPRGLMQFGSLVVCLPCQHEGGVLRVKHGGETVDFAWGHTSQQSIQWAAFYGDCEHEVLEVTEGHRITLTYNLYYSSIGQLAQPVADPHHLPLFDIAREMLLQGQFMRQGGILGFFCHHQYAHSQKSGRKSIPGAFKGVDLAIFSVFHALGLKVGVHPIIENKWKKLGGLPARDLMQGPIVPRRGDFVENFLENLSRKARHLRGEGDDGDGQISYYDEDEGDISCDSCGEEKENNSIVGTKLHGPTFDKYYDEESKEPVSDVWPHQKVSQIVWMNEPQHKDFAHAGLAYGNEATLNYQFSAAAILVVVPSSEKRAIAPAKHETASPRRVVPSMVSPSTIVVATPASSGMSMSMSIENPSSTASPGTNAAPAPNYPMSGPAGSTFNATSGSAWVSDSRTPVADSRQIVPDDEWSAGPGSEWDTVPDLDQGVSSAFDAPPSVASQYGEWSSSTGTELGKGVQYEGSLH